MDQRAADQADQSQRRRPPEPGFLTAWEAAARLGVHERTVRRAIARGDLPAIKQAGVYHIASDALNQFQAGGPPRPAAPDRPPPAPLRLVTPPLATGGLPIPFSPLVGRERELTAIRALARDPEVRLLSLTGP